MEYFRIKNWDKYQTKKTKEGGELHYVKLHTRMLDDPQVMRMSAHEFACWVKLLMYARKFDNKIPQDPRWISARIGFPASHRRVDLAYLWDLGLVEACPVHGNEGGEGKKVMGRGLGPIEGPPTPKKPPKEFLDAMKKIGA